MKHAFIALLLIGLAAGCEQDDAPILPDVNALAREYLLLELAMGAHDNSHVDAYFGPEPLREEAVNAGWSLNYLSARSAGLRDSLENILTDTRDPMGKLRISGLIGRLVALETRIDLAQGRTMPFDEESRRLFGAAAPDYDDAYFEALQSDIDELLPGAGSLADRVVAFRAQFVVPPERLQAVFDAAIAECRTRTLAHVALPANESFDVEYVTDKPWSGYNWYQGDAHSLIQVNTDLPIYINRAVDLGCHEGYPGHHTFNALLEEKLVGELGWQEFTLYPLFSPQSLIAEGSGNYGIELAFPDEERVAFEKDVLFPLAGLDAAEAERYYELLTLLGRLDYAGNEAARNYLDGHLSRDEAIRWLTDFSLTSADRAAQRLDFIDTYRSYVINYNLGRDLVRDYIEFDNADQVERWDRFETLLSSPMTAADIQ